ncbi:MAG: hypothetical protein AAFR96_05795 [Planctomycetota bacterium]
MATSDPPLLRAHRRQYVLGPARWAPDDRWREIRLGSVVLSLCPELRLTEVTDADGAKWVLLGLALQTEANAPSPADEIARTGSRAVSELRHRWAGRWLLLSERAAYLDSHGQIGCLSSRDADGRHWCSSSPVLLREICGNAWQPVSPTYQIGAEFYPPPSCSLVGASRLLPSQTIDPSTGDVGDCDLVPPIPIGRDTGELLDEIASLLRTAFENLPQQKGPLWVGLSGGGDSRVIFAAAVAAHRSVGLDVRPFTWLAGRTPLHDRVLPPKLAALAGLAHTPIRAGRIARSRLGLVREHAGPRLSVGDAVPLLRGVRLGLSGFCTGGQCFDACKATKVGKFPPMTGNHVAVGDAIARVYRERAGGFFAERYTEWVRHVARTPIEGLRYECRWPIEQSGAGWQAPKEQLYDTQLLERFSATNCGLFTSLTMALPKEMGRSRSYEPELVARLAPELNSLPRNPSDAELVGPVRASAIRLRNASERARQVRLRAGRLGRIARIKLDDLLGGR